MFDVLFLYKIINGYIDSCDLVEMIHFHIPSRHTRQNSVFHEFSARSNYAYNSPIIRLHRSGNKIQSIADIFADSLLKIKKSIIAYLNRTP